MKNGRRRSADGLSLLMIAAGPSVVTDEKSSFIRVLERN